MAPYDALLAEASSAYEEEDFRLFANKLMEAYCSADSLEDRYRPLSALYGILSEELTEPTANDVDFLTKIMENNGEHTFLRAEAAETLRAIALVKGDPSQEATLRRKVIDLAGSASPEEREQEVGMFYAGLEEATDTESIGNILDERCEACLEDMDEDMEE